jgi:glycosyltransferase involved in cell wall biosynthesis
MKLFISIRPGWRGGGSNSFADNMLRWARKQRIKPVWDIREADVAIVIAHRGVDESSLEAARRNGCLILHRIDEHFGGFEHEGYLAKHARIQALNRFADITVFQSRFVAATAGPALKPARYAVILNGGDPARFRPGWWAGSEIGHVTWATIPKKRLDRVAEAIEAFPNERFRLVGNQEAVVSDFPAFRARNVRLRGKRSRWQIAGEYRKMKLLYFPSEDDPCPNTVIEAILCGVPVCYHPSGGTPELVGDCGEPVDQLPKLLANLPAYRERCLARHDLSFERMAAQYRELWENPDGAASGEWGA